MRGIYALRRAGEQIVNPVDEQIVVLAVEQPVAQHRGSPGLEVQVAREAGSTWSFMVASSGIPSTSPSRCRFGMASAR